MFRRTLGVSAIGALLAACSSSGSNGSANDTNPTMNQLLAAQTEVARATTLAPGNAQILTSGAATYRGPMVGNITIDRVNRAQLLADVNMEFGLASATDMTGSISNMRTLASDGTVGTLGGAINITAGGVADTFVARGTGQLTRDGAVAPANTLWTLNGQSRLDTSAGFATAVTGTWNVSTLGAVNGFEVSGAGNFSGVQP